MDADASVVAAHVQQAAQRRFPHLTGGLLLLQTAMSEWHSTPQARSQERSKLHSHSVAACPEPEQGASQMQNMADLKNADMSIGQACRKCMCGQL